MIFYCIWLHSTPFYSILPHSTLFLLCSTLFLLCSTLFLLCSTSSYFVLPRPTLFYCILPHLTASYLFSLHPTSSYCILLHLTSSYCVLLRSTSFYLILPHFTSLHSFYLVYLNIPPQYSHLAHLVGACSILQLSPASVHHFWSPPQGGGLNFLVYFVYIFTSNHFCFFFDHFELNLWPSTIALTIDYFTLRP